MQRYPAWNLFPNFWQWLLWCITSNDNSFFHRWRFSILTGYNFWSFHRGLSLHQEHIVSTTVRLESLSVLVLAKPVVLSGLTRLTHSRDRCGLRCRLEIVKAFNRVDKRWLLLLGISTFCDLPLFVEHHTFWSTIAILRRIITFVELLKVIRF